MNVWCRRKIMIPKHLVIGVEFTVNPGLTAVEIVGAGSARWSAPEFGVVQATRQFLSAWIGQLILTSKLRIVAPSSS